MRAKKKNCANQQCRMCRPEIREVAVMLSALPPEDFEHLAARIRMAHAMNGEGSILARLLLARPANYPGYAEFEEKLREVGERMRRGGCD